MYCWEWNCYMGIRAAFSLSRALFRKKCVGPSPGAADPIFRGKKTGDLFYSSPSVSRQFCSVTPTYFLLKNWRPFLVITVTFIHSFTRVSPIISSMLLCCKKFATPLVGPLFCGAPVRPNMLNMPKSAADGNGMN